jgi:hypothetical protein
LPHEHDVGVDAGGERCTDLYERRRLTMNALIGPKPTSVVVIVSG